MAWWQSRHRKTAYERRQQRLRPEARTASRLLHKGGQLSKLGMALQAVLAGTESAPTHTEGREEADAHGIPQEQISERIMEQTVDVPVPQETKATETVCAEPAPAATRRRRTGKRVAPAPAVSYAAPAPLIEYAASEPAVTDTAPAPANEYVAPSPVVISAVRAPVIECVAPVPAVTDTAPTPARGNVAPAPGVIPELRAPVIEPMAPAPGVTSAIRAPAPVTQYASICPAASSSADLSEAAASVASARASEEAFLAELLKTAAHTLPDLSAAAASDAAARANGEALLAGLMETEANLADLVAQSLLIEEAQQAARAKKKPKGAQQGAQAKKKPKTKR